MVQSDQFPPVGNVSHVFRPQDPERNDQNSVHHHAHADAQQGGSGIGQILGQELDALWIDKSMTPKRLKIWTGTAWEIVGYEPEEPEPDPEPVEPEPDPELTDPDAGENTDPDAGEVTEPDQTDPDTDESAGGEV